MIKIGICDDDTNFIDIFKSELEQYFNGKLFSEYDVEYICYDNAKDVIEKFDEDAIDIYFLDIEYGKDLGMDVAIKLNTMRKDIGFVYIANNAKYALKAYVCRPLGFIRKNHINEDMKMAMPFIKDYLENSGKYYVFNNNSKKVSINLNDIQYLYIDNHTMTVVLLNQKIELREKLYRIEQSICKYGFVKINRSCIVNLRFIEEINGMKIIMYNKEVLYASKKKSKEIWIRWQCYKGYVDI